MSLSSPMSKVPIILTLSSSASRMSQVDSFQGEDLNRYPQTQSLNASALDRFWGPMAVGSAAPILGWLAHASFAPIGPRGNLAIGGLLAISVLGMFTLLIRWVRERAWIPALASVLFSGLASRLHLLALVRHTLLFPDAQTYQSQATQGDLTSFWNGTNWSPFWVYLIRIWSKAFSHTSQSQRMLSILTSLFLVIATFAVGRRLLGTFGGLAAALGVSLSPMMAFSSVQGLREEIGIALLVMLVYFVLDPRKNLWSGIAAGASFGLIGLTRMEYLPAGGIILLFAYARRREFFTAAIAIVVATVLLVPQSLLVKAYFGDSAHWQKIFTRGWVNIEYQTGFLTEEEYRRAGEPAPTKEALQKDLFQGPLLTPMEWYFKVHTPREAFRRTAIAIPTLPLFSARHAIWAGANLSYLTNAGAGEPTSSATLKWIPGALGMLGLLLLALRRRWELILLVIVLGATYGVPFLIGGLSYNRDPLVFDMRLSEVFIPFMAVGIVSVFYIRRSTELSDDSVAEPVSSTSPDPTGELVDAP